MSTKPKLSKTQQELLDALKAGVVVHYMPYAGRFNPRDYFSRSDNFQRVTAAAHALIDKDFAKITGGYSQRRLTLIEGDV